MKSNFPNTRFSLPMEPRKHEMGPRVRAIVEVSNGRRRRTSLSAAALALVVCFLCVNLVSCAAVRADSGASSDTQAPAVQPEPSDPQPGQVEAAPISKPEPAAPERPRDSILKVLTGEGEYHYHATRPDEVIDEYRDLTVLNSPEDYCIEDRDAEIWISRFAAVDLDGDGVNEAVLERYCDDYLFDYVIFHIYNGEVTFYEQVPRAFDNPKADGTFEGDSGVLDQAVCRITAFTGSGSSDIEEDIFILLYGWYDWAEGQVFYYIDHQPVSESAYNKAIKEQRNKPDLEWHDFAGADFSEYFD